MCVRAGRAPYLPENITDQAEIRSSFLPRRSQGAGDLLRCSNNRCVGRKNAVNSRALQRGVFWGGEITVST